VLKRGLKSQSQWTLANSGDDAWVEKYVNEVVQQTNLLKEFTIEQHKFNQRWQHGKPLTQNNSKDRLVGKSLSVVDQY